MMREAAPVVPTAGGFRLSSARSTASWRTPDAPVVELPRSASEPMWFRGRDGWLGSVGALMGLALIRARRRRAA